jgi:pilus assembly protein CpaF
MSELLKHIERSEKMPMISSLEPRDIACSPAIAALSAIPHNGNGQGDSSKSHIVLNYGPIESLLADPAVTEIMVNGAEEVYVEKEGRVHKTAIRFADDAQVMKLIEEIVHPLGRRIDRKRPMVDARLPDGSRVNAIIPPCAVDGPSLTIRKFSNGKLTSEDLIRYGTLTPRVGEFLNACVAARLNIIVCGGTGSGKTTLLNALSNYIPDNERIVTIEDSAELQLAKSHVVRLEASPADSDGTGRVTIRDLVVNAMRMRPERIVVGEVRSGEALDMLQAMNTGHDGSLTTLHANSPRDAISRLETITLMGGIDFPLKAVREQIAAALDLIVQIARMRDGSRKIVQVTEVQGMEGDIVVLQDVFRFVEHGLDAEGKVTGDMVPAGIRPRFMPRIEASGIKLSHEVFGGNNGLWRNGNS